jgi:hypothetical protein
MSGKAIKDEPLENSSLHSASNRTSNTSNSGGNIVLSGILSKRGRNKLYHPWVLRSVTIDDQSTLRYYDGKTLKGIVSLTGCAVEPFAAADGRNFAFEIKNISVEKSFQESSLMLAASSSAEQQLWIQTINQYSQRLLQSKANFAYESFDVSYLLLIEINYECFSHKI